MGWVGICPLGLRCFSPRPPKLCCKLRGDPLVPVGTVEGLGGWPRPGCGLLWGAGLSLESLLTNMRCKCIKATAHVVNLGLILAIDVTPPGLHCRRREIV